MKSIRGKSTSEVNMMFILIEGGKTYVAVDLHGQGDSFKLRRCDLSHHEVCTGF